MGAPNRRLPKLISKTLAVVGTHLVSRIRPANSPAKLLCCSYPSICPIDPKMPRAKAEKDPNAPKRPLNAFFLFCKDERNRVKEANKDFKASEVTKELGKLWGEVDAATKTKYEKEMTAYKNRGKAPAAAARGGYGDDEEEE